MAVTILGNGSTINVQKKDDKDKPETPVVDESDFRTVSSRDIAVDDANSAKINITLTGGEEITPYTQVLEGYLPPPNGGKQSKKEPQFQPNHHVRVRKAPTHRPLQLGGGQCRRHQMVENALAIPAWCSSATERERKSG